MNKLFSLCKDLQRQTEKFYFYMSIIVDIQKNNENPEKVKAIAKDYLKKVIASTAREIEETYRDILPPYTAVERVKDLQMEILRMEKEIE